MKAMPKKVPKRMRSGRAAKKARKIKTKAVIPRSSRLLECDYSRKSAAADSQRIFILGNYTGDYHATELF
jgi:hypothetical protein